MSSILRLSALPMFLMGAPLITAQEAIPQALPPALVLGQRLSLDSKILGERREILVSAPKENLKNLPLLVLLDGEWNFKNVVAIVDHLVANGRLPPMVVAGIVNTDRGRDLAPSFDGAEFAQGPADRFLAFITDELIPTLARQHSIGRFHALMGHSNAGAFSLYAYMRRPDAFQANLALSPSYGQDDRVLAILGRALAKPSPGPRFLFLGAGGDEEADISVGALRYAKTFEIGAPMDLDWHFESFPGESHGSVTLRSMYRALELLGQADAPTADGPNRYLSESQRRRKAWIRRFGSSFSNEPLPLYSVSKPLLDRLNTEGRANVNAFWEGLRSEHALDFRFDPIERQNLLRFLDAKGRTEDAQALRAIPGFEGKPEANLNTYESKVDLQMGLAFHFAPEGAPKNRCDPATTFQMQNVTPCADRHGRTGGAFRFNGPAKGKPSFIEAPALSTSGSITVSAWIRPENPAAYSAWISQCRSSWGSQWRLGFGTSPASQWGPTTLAARWTDYWASGSCIPVDRWSQTTAVFDQTLGELRLYLDGRPIQTFTGLNPWTSSQGPLLIGGQRDDGIYFQGQIGAVRIYRRALNAQEVAALAEQD